MGRLLITFKQVQDDWPKDRNLISDILNLYKEGASDTEVQAMIALTSTVTHLSDELWIRWMKQEPIFSSTIKRGKKFSRSWWENQGRTNLKDKSFSPVLWYMNMKNRFGWRDKTETQLSNTDGKPFTISIMGTNLNELPIKSQADTSLENTSAEES